MHIKRKLIRRNILDAREGLREVGSRAYPAHLIQSQSARPQQQTKLLVRVSALWGSVCVIAIG